MKALFLSLIMAVLWAGAPIKEGYEVGDTAADFERTG